MTAVMNSYLNSASSNSPPCLPCKVLRAEVIVDVKGHLKDWLTAFGPLLEVHSYLLS